jgi:hypothetical protein
MGIVVLKEMWKVIDGIVSVRLKKMGGGGEEIENVKYFDNMFFRVFTWRSC